MSMTVARLHKELGKMIAAGHGRKPVAVNVRTFSHPLEDDGAVIVYDATTLEEVRRLPMRKPSGKYNVWNKISFSDGTSH